MSIPLLVKYPGQAEPLANYLNAETTDILPTIADVLGVDHNWNLDGHTLKRLEDKPAGPKTIVRTIMSTATNKEDPYLIAVEDINLFDAILANESLPPPSLQDNSYSFDHSYAKEWLGISIDSLKTIESSREASIPNANRFKNVDLSKRTLAGFLRINIPKKTTGETLLVALALNGKIQATRFIEAENPGLFDAILPEAAFVNGENVFELFLVDESGDTAIFEKLMLRDAAG